MAIDVLKPSGFLGRFGMLEKAADAERSFSPEDTFPSGRGAGTRSAHNRTVHESDPI